MAVNYLAQAAESLKTIRTILHIDFQIGIEFLLSGKIDKFEFWAFAQMQQMETQQERITFVNQVVERLERMSIGDFYVKEALLWEANSLLGSYALRSTLPEES